MSTATEKIEPRKRRHEDAEMDITPMIDITFLLLAFFVVVSTMDPKRAVELPISEVAEKIPEKQCVMIYVDKVNDTDKDAKVFIGDTGNDEVTGTEEEIMEQVAAFVEKTLIDKPELQYVMIKAHGDSKNGQIERLKRAAAKNAGDRKLLVGVENKKQRR